MKKWLGRRCHVGLFLLILLPFGSLIQGEVRDERKTNTYLILFDIIILYMCSLASAPNCSMTFECCLLFVHKFGRERQLENWFSIIITTKKKNRKWPVKLITTGRRIWTCFFLITTTPLRLRCGYLAQNMKEKKQTFLFFCSFLIIQIQKYRPELSLEKAIWAVSCDKYSWDIVS